MVSPTLWPLICIERLERGHKKSIDNVTKGRARHANFIFSHFSCIFIILTDIRHYVKMKFFWNKLSVEEIQFKQFFMSWKCEVFTMQIDFSHWIEKRCSAEKKSSLLLFALEHLQYKHFLVFLATRKF